MERLTKAPSACQTGLLPKESLRFAYSHFAYSRFAFDPSHFAYSRFAYSKKFFFSRSAYSSFLIKKWDTEYLFLFEILLRKTMHNSEGSINSYSMGSSEISLLSVWKEIYACHGSSAIAVNLRSKERDTCYNCIPYATLRVIPTGTRLRYRIQKLEIACKLRCTIATSVSSQWGTIG